MKVLISKERIWWTSTNEDKPSMQYFYNLVKRMELVDMNVNYVNYDNIQVVLPSKDITYMQVIHDVKGKPMIYYYYFQSIQRVLNNGYQAIFTLDTYTTFTMQYLNKLKESGIKVKAIRNHILNESMVQYTDPMLESIPKIIERNEYYCDYIQGTRYNTIPGYEGYGYKISNRNGNGFTVSKGDHLSGTRYYVFKYGYDELNRKQSYIFAPVLWKQIDRNNNKISIDGIDNGNFWAPDNDEVQLIDCANSQGKDKFLGVFTLPSFYEFGKWDRYKITDEKQSRINYQLACLIIDCRLGEDIRMNFGINDIIEKYVDTSNTKPRMNEENKLSYYASRYLDLRIFNQPITLPLFNTQSKYYFNFGNLGFYSYQSMIDTLPNNIIQFPDLQPSITDTYSQMVNSTQNVRDTSKSIAAQQGIMNTFQSLFYGGIGIFKGAITGNPAGIASGVANMGFGFAKSILGYQNKMNMINSQLADYRLQLGTNMSYSTNEQNTSSIDGSVVGYSNLPKNTDRQIYFASTWSRISVLSKSTIQSLNRAISLYGIFNPVFETIDKLLPNEDYNFIQLDAEYMATIFPSTIYLEVPREYYEVILDDITQGIRIWNDTPQYE